MMKDRPADLALIPYRLRRLSKSPQAGCWQSGVRGAGLAFDQITAYLPGDDVRRINWAATARHGGQRVFKNAFLEERDSGVVVLADLSGSMAFGLQRLPKRALAAEITACLAYSARHFGDPVGLIGFTDRVELLYPPRRSTAYLSRLPEAILTHSLSGRGTDFTAAFQALASMQSQAALVFILSDFYVDVQDLRAGLTTAVRRHELVPVVLHDRLEGHWPARRGALCVEDLETGQRRRLYLSPAFRREAERRAADHQRHLRALFQEFGLPWASVHQRDDYVRAIAALFMARRAAPGSMTRRREEGR
jgi:uncharacterized protein (DUF58 family)